MCVCCAIVKTLIKQFSRFVSSDFFLSLSFFFNYVLSCLIPFFLSLALSIYYMVFFYSCCLATEFNHLHFIVVLLFPWYTDSRQRYYSKIKNKNACWFHFPFCGGIIMLLLAATPSIFLACVCVSVASLHLSAAVAVAACYVAIFCVPFFHFGLCDDSASDK